MTLTYNEHESLAYGVDWSRDLKIKDLPDAGCIGERDVERDEGREVGREVGKEEEIEAEKEDNVIDDVSKDPRLLGNNGNQAIYTPIHNTIDLHDNDSDNRRLFASCSFYDHCLRLWMAPIE